MNTDVFIRVNSWFRDPSTPLRACPEELEGACLLGISMFEKTKPKPSFGRKYSALSSKSEIKGMGAKLQEEE